MTELNDHELLAHYACTASEPAFAVLVARYVNLVYSAALRYTGQAQHAEEITQAVFIILARKAGSLGERVVLSVWLYQTARLTAANVMKVENRRQRREQEAYMQSTLNEPESTAAWAQIAPLLDDALGRLGETDRAVLVLRFFENKTAGEIATALRLNEETAQKRVNRALEKLRKYFLRRGVTLSAAAITSAVAANSVQAAPAGLAASITAAALAGTAVSTSAVIAATKTLAMTTLQKTIITATLAVAVGSGIYGARQAAQLREQNQVLQRQQAPLAEALRQMQRAHEAATNQLAAVADELAKVKSNNLELMRLRAQVSGLLQLNSDLTAQTNSLIASAFERLSPFNMENYAVPDTWENVGTSTPTDAVKTFLWATANGNPAKLKEVVELPTDVPTEGFWEAFVNMALTSVISPVKTKGARIVKSTRLSNDECLFLIEQIKESPATAESGEPVEPITIIATDSMLLRRTDGIWHIVLPGGRRLTPDEP